MAKKSLQRELIEWAVLISVIGILFFTGWHTEVIGFVQRGVVATGLVKPAQVETETVLADYDFQLTNAAGRVIDFNEFRGKTIFINFWATWCPPCIAEMPDIHSLYEEMGDQVAFVMISQDDEAEKALRFVDRKGYEFPIYFLRTRLPEVFNHRSIPTTFVVSPDGRVVVNHSGFAKYNSEEFKKLLKEL